MFILSIYGLEHPATPIALLIFFDRHHGFLSSSLFMSPSWKQFFLVLCLKLFFFCGLLLSITIWNHFSHGLLLRFSAARRVSSWLVSLSSSSLQSLLRLISSCSLTHLTANFSFSCSHLYYVFVLTLCFCPSCVFACTLSQGISITNTMEKRNKY